MTLLARLLATNSKNVVNALTITAVAGSSVFLVSCTPSAVNAPDQSGEAKQLLLVSYAVTKNAYDEIIPKFTEEWQKKTGERITIKASYGGSGTQTRAVIDGLEADVVGLAMEADTQRLEEAGLIKPGWQQRLPNNSVPTNSTVSVFVRPGNPKKITGWDDLARPDVEVVAANPKTSGGARWNFIALWGAITENGGSDSKAKEFIASVYKNADVLPKDAREATDMFVTRGQGDVLLNWETEGILAKNKGEWTEPILLFGPNVLTEMPVAVVDRNVDKKGTRKAAEAFAEFLFTPFAQQVFAANGFRPVTEEGKKFAEGKFKDVKFFTIGDFGGWPEATKRFFADGGIWDQIFSQTR